MKRLVGALATFIFATTPFSAHASGFRLVETDNGGQGQAHAITASVNDAAAVYYNPAAMTDLGGYSAKVGMQFIDPRTEYTAATTEYSGQNRNESTANTTFASPHVYLVKGLGDTGWAVGFGEFTNFGLGTTWSNYSRIRYSATDTQLRTQTYNLNVAKKINDSFSAAAGISYMNTDVRYDSMYPFYLFEPGATDGYRILKGTGNGIGFNAALLFKPVKGVNVAVTYRSRIKTKVSGNMDILNFPGTMGALVGGTGGDYTSGAEVDITYPDIAVLAISYSPSERLTLEADVDYTGWSSYDKLTFTFSDPMVLSNGAPILPSTSTQTKDYKNVTAVRVGGSYKLTANGTLRAGYYFDPTPVPDETVDPRLPDADRNLVAIGYGYKAGDNFTMDISYAYLWSATRTVDNNVGAEVYSTVDGDYKTTANIFGLSVGYQF
ncbi:MAG: transporter [Nitrospinae bacterium]|nr:transporter [Nitrospinota bacterium]